MAEKYKKFYMITTAFPFEWQPPKLKYSALFFFHPGPGAEVPFEIWQKLPENERPKHPALVTEDSPDGKGFGGAYEAAAKKYGYTFAFSDPWATSSTDYSAMITKLKAADVDAMLVFGFEKALEFGIINDIWEAANTQEFMDKIQAYAEKFCPPHAASKAVGRIKRAVQSGAEVPFESALAIEREVQQQLFQGEDAKEVLAAYIEKRKGNFSGK